MFAELFVGSAHAASAVPVIPEALGNYQILQFFGGLTILAVGVLAWIAGERRKQQPAASQAVADIHVEGPLAACIARLDRIAAALERIATQQKTTDDFKEDVAQRLSEARKLVYEEGEKLEQRVRATELALAAISGRVRR